MGRRTVVLAALGLLVSPLLAFALFSSQSTETPPAEHLRLGIALQPSSSLVIVAKHLGAFKEEGLAVDYVEFVSGAQAMRDGLLAGVVDVVSTTGIPFVDQARFHPELRALASVFYTDNLNRIVARKDQGILTPSDLSGRVVATQKNSAVHFFLNLFVLYHHITLAEESLLFMKGEELPKALREERIDAFSMREPFVSQAMEELGERGIVFAAPGLYPQYELLVTDERFIANHSEGVMRLLRGLLKAERFIRQQPKEAAHLVAERIGVADADILTLWQSSTPSIALEQSMLPILDEEATWLTSRAGEGGETFNVLSHIETRFMEKVAPESLTLVKYHHGEKDTP